MQLTQPFTPGGPSQTGLPGRLSESFGFERGVFGTSINFPCRIVGAPVADRDSTRRVPGSVFRSGPDGAARPACAGLEIDRRSGILWHPPIAALCGGAGWAAD